MFMVFKVYKVHNSACSIRPQLLVLHHHSTSQACVSAIYLANNFNFLLISIKYNELCWCYTVLSCFILHTIYHICRLERKHLNYWFTFQVYIKVSTKKVACTDVEENQVYFSIVSMISLIERHHTIGAMPQVVSTIYTGVLKYNK